LEKVGAFDESLRMGIDWDLWLRMSMHYKFLHVDNKLVFYRKGHSNQMSKNMRVRYECADRITYSFFTKYGDHFPIDEIKKCLSNNCINRSRYVRSMDYRISLKFLFLALNIYPKNIYAYREFIIFLKGLFKTAINACRNKEC
jgi:hypothetical protein